MRVERYAVSPIASRCAVAFGVLLVLVEGDNFELLIIIQYFLGTAILVHRFPSSITNAHCASQKTLNNILN